MPSSFTQTGGKNPLKSTFCILTDCCGEELIWGSISVFMSFRRRRVSSRCPPPRWATSCQVRARTTESAHTVSTRVEPNEDSSHYEAAALTNAPPPPKKAKMKSDLSQLPRRISVIRSAAIRRRKQRGAQTATYRSAPTNTCKTLIMIIKTTEWCRLRPLHSTWS